MPEETIETEEFSFKISEERPAVIVEVKLRTGKIFETGDIDRVGKFLGDLGKWDTIVYAGSALFEGIGMGRLDGTLTPEHEERHGSEKYSIDRLPWNQHRRVGYKILLGEDERLRRGGGDPFNSVSINLQAVEILKQVKNVAKWHALVKSIKAVTSP